MADVVAAGVQRQFDLDEDGKIYGVERHTAVAQDNQGNTVGLVGHIGVTQDDEGNTHTAQVTRDVTLPGQQTGTSIYTVNSTTQDDEGNTHTAQVTSVVALPGQQTVRQQPALPPPSATTTTTTTTTTPSQDDVTVLDHDRCSLTSIIFFIGCILLTVIPLSMMILGAMHINSCPGDLKLGVYMVVQGIVSMSIPIAVAIWICCHCIDGETLLKLIAPVGVFIFIWFIIGVAWIIMSDCTDSTVHRLAWGYTAPFWFILSSGIICLLCSPFCSD
ncbi:uncharacterized protein LOC125374055 [Haliotis rufescens]|uniref:uncharacterized protein LOC125374055 n=1 Tax=Haliotis rufescens TaxID=6454 RepID=UPI00201EA9C8|nr:uncharacterized protein LOC125374055 [Haliotis rufescens]